MIKARDVVITASAYLDPQFTGEVGKDRARQIFESDVNKANRHMADIQKDQSNHCMETEFEKTTTKKIKRNAVNKRVLNMLNLDCQGTSGLVDV
jgi:long-chain acyl-CoA synthetase